MNLTRIFAAVATATLALGLSACATTQEPAPETTTEEVQNTVVTDETQQQEILAKYDLADMSAREIVEHLESMEVDQRPTDLYASVRPYELFIQDGDKEFTMDLRDEGFHVSFSPYINDTHDCHFHSLTTCTAEMGGEEVEVKITTDEGEVIVDETTTLHPNGYAAYWVDYGTEGTIEVTYGEYSGSVDFTTGEEDATCITTMQLVK